MSVSGLENLQAEDNFFEIGFDSLQVLRLARELNIQGRLANIKPLRGSQRIASVIYSNPTLNQLAHSLFNMAGELRLKDNEQQVEDDRVESMHAILSKHAAALPVVKDRRPAIRADGRVVLLTGSTGSLGSYILNELQADSDVKSVICLDRSSDAAQKHTQTGPKRGLDSIDPRRVKFLQTDLASPRFGLTTEVYDSLRTSVTHIIRKTIRITYIRRRGRKYIGTNYAQKIINGRSTLTDHLGFSSHISRAFATWLLLPQRHFIMPLFSSFLACPRSAG